MLKIFIVGRNQAGYYLPGYLLSLAAAYLKTFAFTNTTCIAGSLVLTLLVFLEYAFIRPYPLENYFSLDLIITFIFILLGNAIYVSLYYYDLYLRSIAENQALAEQLLEETKPTIEHIVVKLGKRDIVVPFPDILFAYSENKKTYLITHDDKTYLADCFSYKKTAQGIYRYLLQQRTERPLPAHYPQKQTGFKYFQAHSYSIHLYGKGVISGRPDGKQQPCF